MDTEKQYELAMGAVEGMAVKIVALPKEKRLLIMDRLREELVDIVGDLKDTELEELLVLVVRAIEARVRELEGA
jgi:hypothetical protein